MIYTFVICVYYTHISIMRTHHYRLQVSWTGNTGSGTFDYRSYERSHQVQAPGKPVIQGSSDPDFRGDASAYNPEELLLSALSACHMLWFLRLAADAGVVVTAYSDEPEGMMEEDGRTGRFTEVILHPKLELAEACAAGLLNQLHAQAKAACFIANSVNFPVRCEPIY